MKKIVSLTFLDNYILVWEIIPLTIYIHVYNSCKKMKSIVTTKVIQIFIQTSEIKLKF